MTSALDAFFKPCGSAVVGASRNPGKAGHQILRNMLDSSYPGSLYPVNPHEEEVLGLRCYPSLSEVQGRVEMVVFAAPASASESFAADLARRMETRGDVKALVVAAAGFAETGTPDGVRRQEELLKCCRRYGVRVLGPNCVGVIDNVNRIDTTFIMGTLRRPGGISFVSQSGAIGAWLIEEWSSRVYPVSVGKFVSLGNMADVDLIEMLDYFGADDATRVVGMYVEGHPRARELVRTAGRIARSKPVVVLKVGASQQGSRAAFSHTGSLAGPDRIYEGAFKQYGIVRMSTVEEFSDALRAFESVPVPAGDRVFVLTQAGGPGVHCVDVLAGISEVEFAPASERTVERLRRNLPSFAAAGRLEGYADITAAATVEQHCEAVRALMEDPSVDLLILITVPTLYIDPRKLGESLAETVLSLRSAGMAKPFLPVILSGEWVREARQALEARGFPTFDTPYRAARAASALIRYAHYRRRSFEPLSSSESGEIA